MSHEFEPLYSLVEIVFSLMRVFSRYLIRINPFQSSGIGYIDRYCDMTKIDEKYMDIKSRTNMHISESWRAYRHDRLFIGIIIHFGTNLGAAHTCLT